MRAHRRLWRRHLSGNADAGRASRPNTLERGMFSNSVLAGRTLRQHGGMPALVHFSSAAIWPSTDSRGLASVFPQLASPKAGDTASWPLPNTQSHIEGLSQLHG